MRTLLEMVLIGTAIRATLCLVGSRAQDKCRTGAAECSGRYQRRLAPSPSAAYPVASLARFLFLLTPPMA
jgi:hypothetical protein